ncbi:MAG TPA: polysaccharide biosynthesis protein [Bacteroidota bacterium]|nr:polysaccharide biosynthesis protein [Bacteroidota bacterium]
MEGTISGLVRRFFFEGQERSIRTKRNIVGLFLLRGTSSVINLVLVPMTLAYLHQTKYGIWITLSSVIGWVSMMDVGLGNGLRNGVAKALAMNEREHARKLVSTTFAMVGLIITGLITVFMVINPLLPWVSILGGTPEMASELTWLGAIVFIFFCLRLLFGLIGTVLIADQKPALATLLEVLVASGSLIGVWVLSKTTAGSLFWLGTILSMMAALVPFCAGLWFFRGPYRSLAPSIQYVDFRFGRELVMVGVQFFALQISGLLIFSSSNIIIVQEFGAAAVVPFNIALKYFGVAATAFTIILLPFWSAYTDAFTRGDRAWILMTIRKLKISWAVMVAGLVVMLLAANFVYRMWVGADVHVSFLMSLASAAYVAIVAWSNIFAYFMNGVGKIRLQLWVAIPTAIVVIPVAIAFSTLFGMESAGVMVAINVCLLPGCFIWPVQLKKLVEGSATGIWAR